jgi:hypothetical protein
MYRSYGTPFLIISYQPNGLKSVATMWIVPTELHFLLFIIINGLKSVATIFFVPTELLHFHTLHRAVGSVYFVGLDFNYYNMIIS